MGFSDWRPGLAGPGMDSGDSAAGGRGLFAEAETANVLSDCGGDRVYSRAVGDGAGSVHDCGADQGGDEEDF